MAANAARQQFLRDKKFLQRARQLCRDRLSVGGDKRIHGLEILNSELVTRLTAETNLFKFKLVNSVGEINPTVPSE